MTRVAPSLASLLLAATVCVDLPAAAHDPARAPLVTVTLDAPPAVAVGGDHALRVAVTRADDAVVATVHVAASPDVAIGAEGTAHRVRAPAGAAEALVVPFRPLAARPVRLTVVVAAHAHGRSERVRRLALYWPDGREPGGLVRLTPAAFRARAAAARGADDAPLPALPAPSPVGERAAAPMVRAKDTPAGGGAPDLVPRAGEGWDGAIVVSARRGGRVDTPLFAGEPAFLDYRYENAGDAPAVAPWRNELLVDGEVVKTARATSDLAPEGARRSSDFVHTFPAPGAYTVTLRLDVGGEVPESDEANNVLGRVVEVVPARPDLSFRLPPAWGDAAVVSSVPGTHVDATVFAGETAYLDVAFENRATVPVETPWDVVVLVDDVEVHRVTLEPLAAHTEGVLEDVPIVFPVAGARRLAVRLDADDAVAEMFEDDGAVEKTVAVGAADAPAIRTVEGRLRVRDGDDERPAGRVQVWVTDAADGRVAAWSETDAATGAFRVEGLSLRAGHVAFVPNADRFGLRLAPGACEREDNVDHEGLPERPFALPPADGDGVARLGDVTVDGGDVLLFDEVLAVWALAWQAHDWVRTGLGYDRDNKIWLHYDHADEGTASFSATWDTLRVCRDDVDATVFHEFGHAVHAQVVGYAWPERGDYDIHRACSVTDPAFALIEGWAEFLEAAIDATDRFEQSAFATLDEATGCDAALDPAPDPAVRPGVMVEGAVAGVFWDLWDAGAPDTDGDGVSAPALLIPLLAGNPEAIADPVDADLVDVFEAWLAADGGHDEAVRAIYRAQLIPLDGPPPVAEPRSDVAEPQSDVAAPRSDVAAPRSDAAEPPPDVPTPDAPGREASATDHAVGDGATGAQDLAVADGTAVAGDAEAPLADGGAERGDSGGCAATPGAAPRAPPWLWLLFLVPGIGRALLPHALTRRAEPVTLGAQPVSRRRPT